ncbi:hypothetical protein AALP_AAs65133U000100 [Arabis alpina]|uniref:Uncharacterized protein n=1 Tax=Arabis alpina TaxID=50452 RepID=A0A087FW99_ARAAL|nr:hypothetical protein AALP_AAs65133U000100 [Arabis alpina]
MCANTMNSDAKENAHLGSDERWFNPAVVWHSPVRIPSKTANK